MENKQNYIKMLMVILSLSGVEKIQIFLLSTFLHFTVFQNEDQFKWKKIISVPKRKQTKTRSLPFYSSHFKL